VFDIVTEAKLFKDFINKGVIAQIFSQSKIEGQVKKSDKLVLGGMLAKQKVMVGASQAARAASDSAYPTAQESTPEETVVRLKRAMMFSIKFDGFALAAAAKDGTPLDAYDFEKQGILMTVIDDMSRQLISDGSGRLAQVNGAVVTSATVNIDSPYWTKLSRFLKKNRIIDIYNPGGTKQMDSKKIVTTGDTSIILDSTGSCDDDSWIFNEDVYPGTTELAGIGECMGLLGICSDADPPGPNAAAGLQGLLVANYPDWKAVVKANGGVKRPLSEDLIISAIDDVEGGMTSVIFITQKTRRAWAAHLRDYKIIDKEVLWGGFSGLPFYYDGKVIPMIPDKFVPDGMMLGLDEDKLTIYVTKEGEEITWEKGRDGSYLQKVANKNEFVAEGHIFQNLGVSIRKAFWKIADIQEPLS